MPAGDRNVNAQYARREIDQIISLNRGRVRFQPPAQTLANVDHSRRTWYFFNPAAIELLRRLNLPFSLFHSHTESDASILQTFEEYVSTRRRGKSIDHWGTRGLSTFYRYCAQEELLSRKSFVEFGKRVAVDFLFASTIDASPIWRASRRTI